MGFILSILHPHTMWPDGLAKNMYLEKMSAKPLSPEGTHAVRNLIEFLSKCQWTPCAHLSKGCFGHLAVSNHDFATLLSSSTVVNFFEQKGEKVSHVISAAKNSATLISTAPGLRAGI